MAHGDPYHQEVPYLPHGGTWQDHHGYPFQQSQPSDEYGYLYESSPVTPLSGHGLAVLAPRSTFQHLAPLSVPPWPSTLTNYSPYSMNPPPAAQHIPFAPASAPPSAPPQLPREQPATRPPANPRRVLTDEDRRNICLCAEQNSHKGQAFIAEMFKVERSTVSKVLGKKEKYMRPEDGNRSPARKKGKGFPEVEKALVNWYNQRLSSSVRPNDEEIVSRASEFAIGAGVNLLDHHGWLDKFKQKMSGRQSPRASAATQTSPRARRKSTPTTHDVSTSSAQITSNATSPRARVRNSSGISPAPLRSQSNASLSSTFTDGGAAFISEPSNRGHSPMTSAASDPAVETSNGSPSPSRFSMLAVDRATQSQRSLTLSSTATDTSPAVCLVKQPTWRDSPATDRSFVPESHDGRTQSTDHDMDSALDNALGIRYHAVSSGMSTLGQTQISSLSATDNTAYASSSPSNEQTCRALKDLLRHAQHLTADVSPHVLDTVLKYVDDLRLNGRAVSVASDAGVHPSPERKTSILGN